MEIARRRWRRAARALGERRAGRPASRRRRGRARVRVARRRTAPAAAGHSTVIVASMPAARWPGDGAVDRVLALLEVDLARVVGRHLQHEARELGLGEDQRVGAALVDVLDLVDPGLRGELRRPGTSASAGRRPRRSRPACPSAPGSHRRPRPRFSSLGPSVTMPAETIERDHEGDDEQLRRRAQARHRRTSRPRPP